MEMKTDASQPIERFVILISKSDTIWRRLICIYLILTKIMNILPADNASPIENLFFLRVSGTTYITDDIEKHFLFVRMTPAIYPNKKRGKNF